MYIHANTVKEALGDFNERLKIVLAESTEIRDVHAFHESGHFEIMQVDASTLPLRFDGSTFSVQTSTDIDEKLLGVEVDHYNKLIGSVGVSDVVTCLSQNPASKKAYQSFWQNSDIFGASGEVPCMTGVHAYIKDDKVFFVTHMRSTNAFKLLEIDIYVGIALQVYLANQLGKGIGTYCHQIASLIVYSKDRNTILGNI